MSEDKLYEDISLLIDFFMELEHDMMYLKFEWEEYREAIRKIFNSVNSVKELVEDKELRREIVDYILDVWECNISSEVREFLSGEIDVYKFIDLVEIANNKLRLTIIDHSTRPILNLPPERAGTVWGAYRGDDDYYIYLFKDHVAMIAKAIHDIAFALNYKLKTAQKILEIINKVDGVRDQRINEVKNKILELIDQYIKNEKLKRQLRLGIEDFFILAKVYVHESHIEVYAGTGHSVKIYRDRLYGHFGDSFYLVHSELENVDYVLENMTDDEYIELVGAVISVIACEQVAGILIRHQAESSGVSDEELTEFVYKMEELKKAWANYQGEKERKLLSLLQLLIF